ncbi:MAG TPA: transporter substrate-binding domain-containing protein [Lachnospiraceae bacterium]|nr:transporter substrate-binding domain-containing protein [Lachnospiraceae bacterium]
MLRILASVFAAVFFVLLLPYSVCAGSGKRTVRIGYYTMANFQEYNSSDQEYRGYSYDYLQAIAQYAGWQYQFVPVTYEKGLEMLEDGELDLMNNVDRTDESTGRFSFSALASGESSTCLVVSPENQEISYEDFTALSTLTVGLSYTDSVNNSAFVDYCKDNDCLPKLVYYHDWDHVLQGMKSGEVNSYLVSSLTDSGMRTVARIGVHSYYFATAKGNNDLLQELNVAMNKLKTENPYFEEELYQKYHSRTGDELTVISESEKEYINSGQDVKVVYNPKWYPLSYTNDNGKFDGALSVIFAKISENTGLRFNYIPCSSEEESLEKFRNGEADIFAGFPYDYTWAAKNNARITVSFSSLPIFTASRSESSGGNRAAAVSGDYLEYFSGNILKNPFSYADYASSEECLKAVLSGQADLAFVDSYEMGYYSKRFAYQNVVYKATGTSYSLSAAVSDRADDRLYSILSKAVASIGSETVNQAMENTSLSTKSLSFMDMLYDNQRLMILVFLILGFAAAMLLAGFISSWRMKNKNAELKKAANAKSEFLSNMSHDMRTPLNGIIGYTGLARNTSDPAEKEGYLEKIKISGEFLLNLINDTLDISKIESGKFTLNPETVSGSEIIRNAVVPIEISAKEKGVHFLVDTERAPKGDLEVDIINTQKVLLNLLSNAVKFTPEGGTVKLTIETIDPPLNQKNCRVVIEDNGIGMDEEFQKKMFEPFTQEVSPAARNIQGTGLGLSIVKQIVTLMGGTISVNSRKGEGTRFEILLPVKIAEGMEKKETGRSAEDALFGKHVLLCEDNEMNTEIAKKVIESRGLIVSHAENGEIGVKKFSDSAVGYYDVVLMDLRMPVMDGFMAAEKIRKLDRMDASSVPILAMSADAYEEDIEKCRRAGMNGHISKPIDNAKLFDALEKACGGKI